MSLPSREGAAYLIPVRLEECEIPEPLARRHWIDVFTGGDYERLLRVLGVESASPPRVLEIATTSDLNGASSVSLANRAALVRDFAQTLFVDDNSGFHAVSDWCTLSE
jgi:hypothetical protein